MYINGIGLISPQNTIEDIFTGNINYPGKEFFNCIEPVYKNYVAPIEYRRLSRIIKLSVVASKICLSDAGIKTPDAIITGTGLGCVEDTEKFLIDLIEKEEELLSPTSFMQSTHNSIGSQIAVLLKCYGYNITYSHRTFSFESALLDGMLFLRENPRANILLGGVDELTEKLFTIKKNICYKNIDNKHTVVLGEGTAYFMLSNTSSISSYAKISAVHTYHRSKIQIIDIKNVVSDFIGKSNLDLRDIDLVMLGVEENTKTDRVYIGLAENLFAGKNWMRYKNLCGDYHTSSSFALALGAHIIKSQSMPELQKINDVLPGEIRNVLIYNHEKNINHSFILISRC